MTADASAPPAPRDGIGVFDSGIGGLSVLRALRTRMPAVPLIYVADSGHAPYGERDDAFVIDRAVRVTQHLLDRGAKLIVVACNTATAVAIEALRTRWPATRFVGVEPGLKPALAASRNGRIGVMATHATLVSARFRRLVDQHAGCVDLHLQACVGLARALESGDPDSGEVRSLVNHHVAPLRAAGVDVVVLGCTHYPFAASWIQQALGPEVVLIDTADAVARRAVELMGTLAASEGREAIAELWTTGELDALQRASASWLDFPVELRSWPPARMADA